jgi:hypothetical protein
LLGEIRTTLRRMERDIEAQTALYLDIGAAVERVTVELAVNTRERRETNEAIARLARAARRVAPRSQTDRASCSATPQQKKALGVR